jgi:hypothetical protein
MGNWRFCVLDRCKYGIAFLQLGVLAADNPVNDGQFLSNCSTPYLKIEKIEATLNNVTMKH